MPKVKNVEKRIWDVEGFDVHILHRDGRDVRGDLKGVPPYTFERAAKNDMTVREWKSNRFKHAYVGFKVEVIDGYGRRVPGNTKLGTVRDSYFED